MHDCSHCGGCGSCGGCENAKSLSLTPEEVDFLRRLGEIPFLPVGRNLGSLTPIYLEEEEFPSILLETLEKKALISLDYDLPLKGYEHSWYSSLPIRGSMALTQRGQQVLEILEYQGASEE